MFMYENVTSLQIVPMLGVVGQKYPLGTRQTVAQIPNTVSICCPESRDCLKRPTLGSEPDLETTLVGIVNF